jgi:tripartite-type tricarboxylate transporter receptor subunit TctC
MKRIFIAFCMMLVTSMAFAWEPTKPINVFVGFPPGSGDDILIRPIAAVIEKQNPGVSFIIQNRAGAGGVIALNDFPSKPKDGHNLMVIGRNAFTVAPIVYKDAVTYKESDFDKILTLAATPNVLVVAADSPMTNVSDLINTIKNSPLPTLIGASSPYSEGIAKIVVTTAGLSLDKLTVVNYKGPGDGMRGIAQKEVVFTVANLATVLPLIDAGKIKPIGFFTDSKIKDFPSTPLVNVNNTQLIFYSSWGIGLPKDTPKEINNWFREKFIKALQSEEIKSFFVSRDLVIRQNELTEAGYTKGVAADREKFEKALLK